MKAWLIDRWSAAARTIAHPMRWVKLILRGAIWPLKLAAAEEAQPGIAAYNPPMTAEAERQGSAQHEKETAKST